jgi:hypothetical protein
LWARACKRTPEEADYERAHGGVLARSVRAQQREYLAVIDGEGQVVDRNEVAATVSTSS